MMVMLGINILSANGRPWAGVAMGSYIKEGENINLSLVFDSIYYGYITSGEIILFNLSDFEDSFSMRIMWIL